MKKFLIIFLILGFLRINDLYSRHSQNNKFGTKKILNSYSIIHHCFIPAYLYSINQKISLNNNLILNGTLILLSGILLYINLKILFAKAKYRKAMVESMMANSELWYAAEGIKELSKQDNRSNDTLNKINVKTLRRYVLEDTTWKKVCAAINICLSAIEIFLLSKQAKSLYKTIID